VLKEKEIQATIDSRKTLMVLSASPTFTSTPKLPYQTATITPRPTFTATPTHTPLPIASKVIGAEGLVLESLKHVTFGKGAIVDLVIDPERNELIVALSNQLVLINPNSLTETDTVKFDNTIIRAVYGQNPGLLGVATMENAGIYDIEKQEWVYELRGSDYTAIAVSMDGTRLALGTRSGSIELYDITTHQKKLTLSGHTAGILDLDFSPGGEVLASSSADATARLWNTESGVVTGFLYGHQQEIPVIGYHPDGNSLVTGCDDDKFRVFTSPYGGQTFTSKSLQAEVTGLDFNPDGTLLAVCTSNKQCGVYNTTNWDKLDMVAPGARPVAVTFSADGTLLLVGLKNGELLAYGSK
jgi:WD40 repeat protein